MNKNDFRCINLLFLGVVLRSIYSLNSNHQKNPFKLSFVRHPRLVCLNKLHFPPLAMKDIFRFSTEWPQITLFKSTSIFIHTVFDVVRRFVVAIVRETRSFSFQRFGLQFRLKKINTMLAVIETKSTYCWNQCWVMDFVYYFANHYATNKASLKSFSFYFKGKL